MNYKVYVFDLDDTLYLHKVDLTYSYIYNFNLKKFLEKLKNKKITMCIATHNKYPYMLLDRLNIKHYFSHIISESKDTNITCNLIENYTSKIDMMNDIITKTNCKKSEIIFFDDNTYNINQIESMGIKSILVSHTLGILFNDY